MHCGHLNYLTAFFFPIHLEAHYENPDDATDSVYKEPVPGLKLFLSSLNNMTASLLQLQNDWLLVGLRKARERKH